MGALYFPGATLGAVRPWAETPAATPAPATTGTGSAPATTGASFDEVLQQAAQQQELQFSGHAKTRLQSRNLELTPERMERLQDGVDQAAAKGAKSSLVLLDNLALVVSVPNRTVITAMDCQQLKSNVFTNIDSAVIV